MLGGINRIHLQDKHMPETNSALVMTQEKRQRQRSILEQKQIQAAKYAEKVVGIVVSRHIGHRGRICSAVLICSIPLLMFSQCLLSCCSLGVRFVLCRALPCSLVLSFRP